MLRDTITSVLAQTWQDFEIVVSDNASEDDTETVVRSFGNPRIVYVRNSRDIGATSNINNCFAMTRSEFVALCPDDM